jgi:SAM-dependent methyltransferase
VFERTQRFYDLVYSWKDYPAEAARLHSLVQARKRSPGNSLLDVACGTGKHMELLRDNYDVEGLDLDAEMLAVARQRLPGVPLHLEDFRGFDLGRLYDVVVCLFSSIAYARNTNELEQAIACLARHVQPGGVVVVEPFFAPDDYRPGYVQMLCVEEPDLKITRMSAGVVRDQRVHFDFHYLVGHPTGIDHIVEAHELSLFRVSQYMDAFRSTELVVQHDAEGLMGRGLFVGTKPL